MALCFGLLTSRVEQLAGGVEILLKYCKKVTVCWPPVLRKCIVRLKDLLHNNF